MKLRYLWFLLLATLLAVGMLPAPAAAAGCDANIVFSELDYDQPSTDSIEFIELRILAGVTISQCELRLINGATPSAPAVYRTIDLSGTYAADKYLVIGSTGVASRDITIGGTCATDCIQNGPNDGFALVDTSGFGSLVWFVSYEGQITNFNPGDGSSNSSTDLPVSDDGNTPNRSIHNGPASGVADAYLDASITPGNMGPNAVTLRSLAARVPAGPWAASLPLLALIAAGGLAVGRRRR